MLGSLKIWLKRWSLEVSLCLPLQLSCVIFIILEDRCFLVSQDSVTLHTMQAGIVTLWANFQWPYYGIKWIWSRSLIKWHIFPPEEMLPLGCVCEFHFGREGSKTASLPSLSFQNETHKHTLRYSLKSPPFLCIWSCHTFVYLFVLF